MGKSKKSRNNIDNPMWQPIEGFKRKITCKWCGKKEVVLNQNKQVCYECDKMYKYNAKVTEVRREHKKVNKNGI